MSNSRISQGPWTRVRPLQRDELDVRTHAAMTEGELTWGSFPNNLCRVMAYCPRLIETEIEYCNTFIFDPAEMRHRSEFDEPGRRDDRDHVVPEHYQVAGFLDRFLKELVISKTSLINRSRYSVTHHAFLGYVLYATAGRADEAHAKYLHLHEHDKHPNVYTERELAVLDYTDKVVRDAHLVSDNEFAGLRQALATSNTDVDGWDEMPADEKDRHVDAQIVELTWLIGHFCLLNRWFTVLQVPDEGPEDEVDFSAVYAAVVPQDIRDRNEAILNGDF